MSTDLAVRSSGQLASLDEFDAIITGEKDPEESVVIEDPELISREIIRQLLAAESDDDLQNFGNAEGWRLLMGVPIELRDFRWRPSSFDEGGPLYVVVTGRAQDEQGGRDVILTTGSSNVLAQLSNLARREINGTGKLRGSVWKLEESERVTSNGYRPLHLAKVADSVDEL